MKESGSEHIPTAPDVRDDLFSLVIYQNDAFVSALLQQLLNIGLPLEEFTEAANQSLKRQTVDGTGSGTVGFDLTIPGTPIGLKTGAQGDVNAGNVDDNSSDNRHSRSFRYTQANFLHNVRQQLVARSLITKVSTVDSLEELKPGSFVEYSASFEPNELNSILDLVTPDLVASIVKDQYRQKAIEGFDFSAGGHEARTAFAERLEMETESKLELTMAATRAVRQDFRNETTREYFGQVTMGEKGKKITAVTICDSEYFAGQDKDRVLDGDFKVLGKVTDISYKRESILRRNKILNRVQQAALDQLQQSLADAGLEGMFDTKLKLHLHPPIVRVIPIAIYV